MSSTILPVFVIRNAPHSSAIVNKGALPRRVTGLAAARPYEYGPGAIEEVTLATLEALDLAGCMFAVLEPDGTTGKNWTEREWRRRAGAALLEAQRP